jgi:hypothetical protein
VQPVAVQVVVSSSHRGRQKISEDADDSGESSPSTSMATLSVQVNRQECTMCTVQNVW